MCATKRPVRRLPRTPGRTEYHDFMFSMLTLWNEYYIECAPLILGILKSVHLSGTAIMPALPTSVPPFEQLPLRKGDPPYSAWGLWGDGPESVMGSLNYLTDEVMLRTVKQEVKTGERVGLKYVILRKCSDGGLVVKSIG